LARIAYPVYATKQEAKMADHTVRVENMDKSNARVALDLMEKVKFSDKAGSYVTKQELLSLYVDCLDATFGNRGKEK
jgi:ATP-dependent Zn protease